MTPEQAAALRAAFPPETVGTLPKPYKADSQKGNCPECGGYHGLPAVHLSYVGHAAVTDRLLQVDPDWHWEPMAVDPTTGAPLIVGGCLWIRLTVCGVTRIGVGDGKNAKECIGDAIRNAAMRFGVALDLWAKESLIEGQHDAAGAGVQSPDPAKQQARALRTQIGELAGEQGWDLTVLGQEFVQTHGVESSSATPEMLTAFLSELQARAAPPDDAPADPPPPAASPVPEGEAAAKDEPPGKSADDYRAELAAATKKPQVIAALRALELAGRGGDEVGDDAGNAMELRAYAQLRLKEVS